MTERATFLTTDGVDVPSVTADQMREIDRVAVEETGPNLFQMMENAGRNLASVAIDQLGIDWAGTPIVVLAGRGGNGGGGICAARHLANRGADVTVVVVAGDDLEAVPAWQLHVYEGTNGSLAGPGALSHLEAGLVIDAMVGYGWNGLPRGPIEDAIAWAGATPTLSLDVPTGLDATTGETPGAHVNATRTLTLALPKTGLTVPAVGELWLADLGIPAVAFRRQGIEVPPGLFGSSFVVKLLQHTDER